VAAMRSRLTRAGYRLTTARLAVMEVLGEGLVHPTAESVYERVRATGERGSRASVYRALGALEQAGAVRRVSVPNGPARFELIGTGDEAKRPDWHMVCQECGRVVDIDGAELAALRKAGTALTHCQVRLRGICRRCREAARASANAVG
jgi:Fe2+ or Zn2+ uptake regulation protein